MRGAIVTYSGKVGIAWDVTPSGTYLFPVIVRGAGRHRSDVQHEDSRLPARGTIRPGAMRIEPRVTVVGHVSRTLLAQIEQAFAAEKVATRFEAVRRFPVDPPTETPVRQ